MQFKKASALTSGLVAAGAMVAIVIVPSPSSAGDQKVARLAALEQAVPSLKAPRVQAATDPAVTQSPLSGPDDIVDLDNVHRPKGRSGQPLFVAPLKDGTGVCVGAPGRLNCASREAIELNGASASVSFTADGQYSLTAIVGKATSGIAVAYPDGATESYAPIDGAIAVDLPRAPANISWSGPAGLQQVQVPTGADG